jgi:hypothetical protein
VTPALLSRFRRHAVVLCVVGAAFITPGSDPLSMLVLAGPLYLLFEMSVVLSSVVFRSRQRREAAKAAEEAAEAAAEAAALAAAEAARPAVAPEPEPAAPRRLGDVPAPLDQQGLA